MNFASVSIFLSKYQLSKEILSVKWAEQVFYFPEVFLSVDVCVKT